MKHKLITLTTAAALAVGAAVTLHAHPHGEKGAGHRGHRKMFRMGMGVEHLTKDLDLTDAQKAQVQPIVDQAKPQLRQIHREAMEKSKAVLDTTAAQIRPLLTPPQQQKFDAMRAAHEKMREGMRELHEAKQQ